MADARDDGSASLGGLDCRAAHPPAIRTILLLVARGGWRLFLTSSGHALQRAGQAVAYLGAYHGYAHQQHPAMTFRSLYLQFDAVQAGTGPEASLAMARIVELLVPCGLQRIFTSNFQLLGWTSPPSPHLIIDGGYTTGELCPYHASHALTKWRSSCNRCGSRGCLLCNRSSFESTTANFVCIECERTWCRNCAPGQSTFDRLLRCEPCASTTGRPELL